LVRLGRLDDVRGLLAQVPLGPLPDTWSLTWDAACRAEVAYVLDDPGLAARAAPILRRLSGRLATAGVSIVAGPLDGYLALAEAAWAIGRPPQRPRTGRSSRPGLAHVGLRPLALAAPSPGVVVSAQSGSSTSL
jgi:hypothetical protein